MDFTYYFRPGDTQNVIVASERNRVGGIDAGPVSLFVQPVFLYHGSHGTIVNGNLTGKQLGNVLTQTIATKNKVGKPLWIDIDWLCIVNLLSLFGCQGTFFMNDNNLFMCKFGVDIRIGNMVSCCIRTG